MKTFRFFLALTLLALAAFAGIACNKKTSPTAPRNFEWYLQGTGSVIGVADRSAQGLLVTVTDNLTAQRDSSVTDSKGLTAQMRWNSEPTSIRVAWVNAPGTGINYTPGSLDNPRVTCVQHPESSNPDVQLCRFEFSASFGGPGAVR